MKRLPIRKIQVRNMLRWRERKKIALELSKGSFFVWGIAATNYVLGTNNPWIITAAAFMNAYALFLVLRPKHEM